MSAAAPAPPGAPDALDRAGEALGERLNPIIVKEIRQNLRARTFSIFFALMLLACLTISLVVYAANDGSEARTGQYTFIAFFVCLACVQFFVIPYSAYRSMARELEDETWVLLTLTGLGPRRILAGKIGSFVLQGLLYASAAAPFLLFSYYLNGIDLPTILIAVVIAAGYQLFLTAASVSVATLARSRIVRGLHHFVLLGGLFWAVVVGISSSIGVAEDARSLATYDVFWVAVAATLFGLVTTGLLLFEAAAAGLSLPTEAYAKGPRVLWLVQLLGGALLFALAYLVTGQKEFLGVGAVTTGIYAAVAGTFVLADRDGMAPNHWARGGRFSLLRPGAFRALLVQVLGLGVASGGLVLAAAFTGKVDNAGLTVLLTAPALALLYLAAPQVVARWAPHPPHQTPMMVRVVFVGLLMLGGGVPPLAGQLYAEQPDHVVLNVFNPVLALVNAAKFGFDYLSMTLLVWGAAVGMTAWAFLVLARNDGGARA